MSEPGHTAAHSGEKSSRSWWRGHSEDDGVEPRLPDLESHLDAELKCSSASGPVNATAAALRAGDISVRGTRQRCGRVAELRRVGNLEAFQSQLGIDPLRDFEVLE